MTIKYREGGIHLNADPLSRAPIRNCNKITVVDSPEDFTDTIVEAYIENPQRLPRGSQNKQTLVVATPAQLDASRSNGSETRALDHPK